MFWNIVMITGVVALIQCQPPKVNTTTVSSYVTPGEDQNAESETENPHSQEAPAVHDLTDYDNMNFENWISGDESVTSMELRTTDNNRIKRRSKRIVPIVIVLGGLAVTAGTAFIGAHYIAKKKSERNYSQHR